MASLDNKYPSLPSRITKKWVTNRSFSPLLFPGFFFVVIFFKDELVQNKTHHMYSLLVIFIILLTILVLKVK